MMVNYINVGFIKNDMMETTLWLARSKIPKDKLHHNPLSFSFIFVSMLPFPFAHKLFLCQKNEKYASYSCENVIEQN